MSVMVPKSGKGKEITDFLRRELGIPEGVQSFEIRIAMNEAITVKCQYLAQDNGKTIFEEMNHRSPL